VQKAQTEAQRRASQGHKFGEDEDEEESEDDEASSPPSPNTLRMRRMAAFDKIKSSSGN
jgi:hypothetical protein